MNREEKLLKNTTIIVVGQLSSKVFTFFLLPIYTSLLVPYDYGIVDALQTIINLVLYITTLQIESAVFRFIVDNRECQQEESKYITCGCVVIVVMSTVSTMIMLIINHFFNIPYFVLLVFSLWSQAWYFYLSNVARGLEKNLDYSIASFIVTVTSLIVNIFFILVCKLGAVSILLALIISSVSGLLYYVFKLKIWKYIILNMFEQKKCIQMLKYSLPLIPSALSWWVVNTSDRLLILLFLGSTYNGIYAAANKIPIIYTTVFSAFNLAWTESVSLSMKDDDYSMYINSILNTSYKFFSFINLEIIACVAIVFDSLFGDNYILAYNQIYILLVAIFINSMCSLYGGILVGLKNSKAIGVTTTLGAFLNFLLNFVFIKWIGLYAASISTLLSYIVIYVCRKKAVKKSIKISMSRKYSVQLIVMFGIVSMNYFSCFLLMKTFSLFVLTIWGCVQNADFLLPIYKHIREKLR